MQPVSRHRTGYDWICSHGRAECIKPARRTHRNAGFEICANGILVNGVSFLFVVIKSPLLDSRIDLHHMVDARICLCDVAGFDEIRNGPSRQCKTEITQDQPGHGLFAASQRATGLLDARKCKVSENDSRKPEEWSSETDDNCNNPQHQTVCSEATGFWLRNIGRNFVHEVRRRRLATTIFRTSRECQPRLFRSVRGRLTAEILPSARCPADR